MSRLLTVLFAFAFCTGVLAVGMAVAYLAAGLLGPLTNIIFLMLVFVMIIATLLTLAERKWSALIQDRIGPDRARIDLPGLRHRSLGGLPHVLADAVKMLIKEDFIPLAANKLLFNLGPILAFAPVFALFAVVPVGPSIRVFDRDVALLVTNPDFGILYVFAIASLAVYGTSLAGWSSNNKLALLGGVRAASQMISYEVALGLSLVGIMMAFSTVQLPSMVDQQTQYLWSGSLGPLDVGLPAWGFFLQPLGFVLFFAAAFAETKRAPFDVPEGESEIIGYFVEYSGMKFGMFMISEFVEIVVLSALITTVFFGGYHLPFGEGYLGSLSLFRDYPIVWGTLLATVFWIKVLLLCWLQLAIRWTFPRFRYDQIQTLGWKMLLPLGLVNVFVSGALVLHDPSLRMLAIVGMAEIALILALTVFKKVPHEESHAADLASGTLAPGHAPAAHAAHPH
jgi:NADH-quinone oxidoreductase subunit H